MAGRKDGCVDRVHVPSVYDRVTKVKTSDITCITFIALRFRPVQLEHQFTVAQSSGVREMAGSACPEEMPRAARSVWAIAIGWAAKEVSSGASPPPCYCSRRR